MKRCNAKVRKFRGHTFGTFNCGKKATAKVGMYPNEWFRCDEHQDSAFFNEGHTGYYTLRKL